MADSISNANGGAGIGSKVTGPSYAEAATVANAALIPALSVKPSPVLRLRGGNWIFGRFTVKMAGPAGRVASVKDGQSKQAHIQPAREAGTPVLLRRHRRRLPRAGAAHVLARAGQSRGRRTASRHPVVRAASAPHRRAHRSSRRLSLQRPGQASRGRRAHQRGPARHHLHSRGPRHSGGRRRTLRAARSDRGRAGRASGAGGRTGGSRQSRRVARLRPRAPRRRARRHQGPGRHRRADRHSGRTGVGGRCQRSLDQDRTTSRRLSPACRPMGRPFCCSPTTRTSFPMSRIACR